MDFINYNKNYLSEITKQNNFTLTKNRLNDIFNDFANYSNQLRELIANTNSTIYQSVGNFNSFFVNVGDGTIQQRRIQEIIVGEEGFSLNRIPSLPVERNSILQVNNANEINFVGLNINTTIKSNNNNIDFGLITKNELSNQIISPSIFANNSIGFDRFKDTQITDFIYRASLTEKNLYPNFQFDIVTPDYGDGSDKLFNFSRKSWDWIKPLNDQCEDTNLMEFLHLMITPKSIADNCEIMDSIYSYIFRFSPFWSIYIKTKNKKMHNWLLGSASSQFVYPDDIDKPNPTSRVQDSEVNKYLTFYLANTLYFDNIRYKRDPSVAEFEIEDCGTFSDNLFTYDTFVSFDDTYVKWYPSYIGAMHITRNLLKPDFKVNKRMCYESIYADYTKRHGRPALQKQNVPDAILNRLRTHYGVVDSDWDYEGVYN